MWTAFLYRRLCADEGLAGDLWGLPPGRVTLVATGASRCLVAFDGQALAIASIVSGPLLQPMQIKWTRRNIDVFHRVENGGELGGFVRVTTSTPPGMSPSPILDIFFAVDFLLAWK